MKFKEEYENLYGVVHPTFYLGSYAQVNDVHIFPLYYPPVVLSFSCWTH